MAEARTRVTIFAKSTSVSASPVRPGKTYPLSALDHTFARHTLRLVFYYRAAPDMDRNRLKDSLSEVLSHYPAVTGRMMPAGEEGAAGNDWRVKCSDAGVRVLDARARGTLDEWLGSATDEEEMDLAYWEPMGADYTIWSPFYIQITEFEDKAFAVGLSCLHMHADPTCAMLIFRAWSDAHRRACIAYPPFLHPPAFLPRPQPHPSAPLLALKSAAAESDAKMSSATFVFSDAAVKSLFADLDLPADASSPFDALAALFWTRIASARAAELGPADLTICLDFRKRMHAPLPHGFYGNALHLTRAHADLSAGPQRVAQELRRHVDGIGEDEFWEAIEWVHERRQAGKREAFQMYGPELTCVALDHVFAYGAGFGAARPAHVTCRIGGVEGEGVVMVMPAASTADEGAAAARTVTVTLPLEVTARILRDDAIMKYGPTVMFAAASRSSTARS